MLLLFFGLSTWSCGSSHPNLIIISIDSFRADQLNARVDGRSLTPRMDALADESVVFEHAVAPAPWTTPSLISLMTGLLPVAHGVFDHDRALAQGTPTLAERFAAAGYRTAAFVPAVTLRPEFGFGRGFEIYDYEEFGHTRVSSPRLSGKLLNQLDRWRDERSFIWIHLWDPHYNYNPPTPFDDAFRRGERPPSVQVQCLKWFPNAVTPAQGEFLRSQQEGELNYTDHYLGEIVDELAKNGRLERTILVILADHGEAFLEHGWLGHTNRVDETLVHVPLMIHWPQALSPVRINATVSTASLGRTLLELAQLPDPGSFGSERCLPLVSPPKNRGRDAIAETRRRGCLTALVRDHDKYIINQLNCRESFFDLSRDPGEREDLAGSATPQLLSARRTLAERLRSLAASAPPRAMLASEIVDEARQRLLSLSYVGGGSTHAATRNEDPCAQLHNGTEVDSFGDRADELICPERGALDCLDKLLAAGS